MKYIQYLYLSFQSTPTNLCNIFALSNWRLNPLLYMTFLIILLLGWKECCIICRSIHFTTTAHTPETPSKQSVKELWKWAAEHSQKCYELLQANGITAQTCIYPLAICNIHGEMCMGQKRVHPFKVALSDFSVHSCPQLKTTALSPPSQRRSHNHIWHSKKHTVGKEKSAEKGRQVKGILKFLSCTTIIISEGRVLTTAESTMC